MRFRIPFAILTLSIPLALQAPPARAADPAMDPAMAAMMEDWLKLGRPGEHHKALEPFAGKWNTTQRMWMGGPGSEASVSKGTSTIRWVLDGRFLMEDHAGEMMGAPYTGIGLTGYDNYRNVFVATWINNVSTALLTMTGTADPSGKTITLYGEMDEPGLKMIGRMVKYVSRIVDADTRVFTIYDLAAGDDYKVVEIAYSRAK